MGYQGEAMGLGRGCNQQVVSTDQASSALEMGANFAIGFGSGIIER